MSYIYSTKPCPPHTNLSYPNFSPFFFLTTFASRMRTVYLPTYYLLSTTLERMRRELCLWMERRHAPGLLGEYKMDKWAEGLRFSDKSDILLEMRLGGAAEQGNIM